VCHVEQPSDIVIISENKRRKVSVLMIETNVSIPIGDMSLAGTLATPDGEGPFPAALLVAGSGPLDRDGNHKRLPLALSKDLAMILNEAGSASLRFDKRGVGESNGDYLSTGFYDELADATSALKWLISQPTITRVVPVGHSAGALYAGEMSAAGNAPSGAVLLAYPTSTGEETLIWQASEIGESVPRWVKVLLKTFRTSIEKQQSKALTKLKNTSKDVVRIQGQRVNAKWMREFLAYDPKPVLRSTTSPLIAITGSKDVQVNPADIDTIEAITGDHATAVLVNDVDHILRTETAPVSNPKKYKKQITQPIDSRVVDTVVRWLASTAIDDAERTNTA
jgi:alpha/beta superfamily hydrolase